MFPPVDCNEVKLGAFLFLAATADRLVIFLIASLLLDVRRRIFGARGGALLTLVFYQRYAHGMRFTYSSSTGRYWLYASCLPDPVFNAFRNQSKWVYGYDPRVACNKHAAGIPRHVLGTCSLSCLLCADGTGGRKGGMAIKPLASLHLGRSRRKPVVDLSCPLEIPDQSLL